MIRILVVALLTWLLGSGVNLAQESEEEPPAQTGQDTPAPEEAGGDSGEALPDIDVWAEEDAGESDVFVPTESISADSSIAFPSDI
jgi:hypothetical protein